MLRKLFKLEFKSTSRKFVPIILCYFLVSLILKIFMSIGDKAMDNVPMQIGLIIVSLLYTVLTYTVSLYAVFGSISRFRKNMFTDEGYLMNTLPVKPWHHIISKLISAFIWYIISGIVIVASTLILAYENGIFKAISNFLKNVGIDLSEIWDKFPVICILVVVLSFVLFIYSMLLFYMGTSIGNTITSGKKTGITVVTIIGLLCGSSFLSSYSFVFLQNLVESLNITEAKSIVTFILAFYCIAAAIFSAIFYFVTNYIIKNKLNLE